MLLHARSRQSGRCSDAQESEVRTMIAKRWATLTLALAAFAVLNACKQPHLPQLKQPKFMRWFDNDAGTSAAQPQQGSGYLVGDSLDGVNRVCVYDDLG